MYKKFTRLFGWPPGYVHKFLLIMKLTAFILLASLLQVSAAGFAQKVTLKKQNASLEQVFKEIHNQTGYNFIYTGKLIAKANPVSINLKEATLEQALDACFTDQPLEYTIDQKTIIVKEKPVPSKTTPATPKDITGQVIDKKGSPLPSATVTIKRTKKGTLTDVKGNFTLHDVLPDDIIIVTYIGYQPLAVQVGDKKEFKLALAETQNALDQVVVQAYGETSKRLSTGNIGTVSAKEIEQQPVTNVLAALMGKIPGLVVTPTSGFASAPFKIEIQGRDVIDPNRASEPLIVIDGVPLTVLENSSGTYDSGSRGFLQNGMLGPAGGQSPLFSLNPNDIESVSVLKDADATAIYGSRGSNGVILITTKRGSEGEAKLDVSAYHGVSAATQRAQLLNSQQYVAMREEAFRNDGIVPNQASAYDFLSWNPNRYTDWQKLIIGNTGITNNAQLTLSGGNKQTTFRISGTYYKGNTILTSSGGDQKASVQFNLAHKSINQRLNISFSGSYSNVSSDYSTISSGIIALAPTAPGIYNNEGQLNWRGWDPVSYLFPFSNLLVRYKANTGFLTSSLNLKYEIVKGLSFSTNFGYSVAHSQQEIPTPISSQDPTYNPTGSSQFGNNQTFNSIIEPQLNYHRFIGKGTFDVLVGSTAQSATTSGNVISGSGYVNDLFLGSIANAATKDASDNTGTYKYYAVVFGRINFNWEDKYLINLSARRDGSSRFGQGKQFGNFGAVGTAWIFTQENWAVQNLPWLSFGKLRASYGITGNDNIGEYRYLSQWSGAVEPYGSNSSPAYNSIILPNPDLHWEVNKKLELGFNLGILKDRISLEFNWYRNICGDQLVQYPLPAITGFTFVTANLNATIQNKGIETTISAKIIDNKDFKWTLRINSGTNQNKLLAFPNIAQSPYANLFVVGQSLNIAKLLHVTGVDPQTGQYTFEDKNHDGQIITDVGNPKNDFYNYDLTPKLDGGIAADFTYKSLQLSLFFHGKIQRSFSAYRGIAIPGAANNFPVEILDRWQKPGDIAKFARFTTQPQTSDYNYFQYGNSLLIDGSYLRLQNLSLAYNLPIVILNKIGFHSGKVFFQGENLFILTKYDGIDPDIGSIGSLPPIKIYTIGLEFNL